MDAKTRHASLLLLLIASIPASAQSVGDLAEIQAQTLIYRAQAARAEAQQKAGAGTGAAAGVIAPVADVLPVIRGVYGQPGKLFATFLYSSGSTIDAGVRDRLPGGFTVRTVTPTRVEIFGNGRTHVLSFSSVRPIVPTPSSDSAAATAAVPTLP